MGTIIDLHDELLYLGQIFSGPDTLDLAKHQHDNFARDLFDPDSDYFTVRIFWDRYYKAEMSPSDNHGRDFESDLDYIRSYEDQFRRIVIPAFCNRLSGGRPFKYFKRFVKSLFSDDYIDHAYTLDRRFGDSFTSFDVVKALVSYHRTSCLPIIYENKEFLYGS